MKKITKIAIANAIIGVLAIILPLDFYSSIRDVFSTVSPPPFEHVLLLKFVLILSLPSIVFIVNAIALLVVEDAIIAERRKILRKRLSAEEESMQIESGEVLEEAPEKEIEEKKEELNIVFEEKSNIGKEVYSDIGEFLGNVTEEVKYENKLYAIKVRKKDKETEIPKERIESIGEVIIVKAKEREPEL